MPRFKIFVDESGTLDFSERGLSQQPYFIVVGVVFNSRKAYREFERASLELKTRWFGRLGKYLAIHGADLYQPAQQVWKFISRERDVLAEEYLSLVLEHAKRGAFNYMAVGINKLKIRGTAQERDWYSISLFMALERILNHLPSGSKVKIFAEKRSPNEDRIFRNTFHRIAAGTFSFGGRCLSDIGSHSIHAHPVLLSKGKEQTLDLADILAYYCKKRYVDRLDPNGKGSFETIGDLLKRRVAEVIVEYEAKIEALAGLNEKFYLWPK